MKRKIICVLLITLFVCGCSKQKDDVLPERVKKEGKMSEQIKKENLYGCWTLESLSAFEKEDLIADIERKGNVKFYEEKMILCLKNDNENCETFSYDIDDDKINIKLLNNNDEDYIIPYYFVDLYESSIPTLVLSYVLDGIQVDYHLKYGC